MPDEMRTMTKAPLACTSQAAGADQATPCADQRSTSITRWLSSKASVMRSLANASPANTFGRPERRTPSTADSHRQAAGRIGATAELVGQTRSGDLGTHAQTRGKLCG